MAVAAALRMASAWKRRRNHLALLCQALDMHTASNTLPPALISQSSQTLSQAWGAGQACLTSRRSLTGQAPPAVNLVQGRHGVLWVTDLTAAEWCSLQTTFQLLSGKAKEETEAMKEGTAVHDAREAEVVSRISVAVTSPEDKRAMRVLNMIVQLRQLVSEGRTREVELFARVRPGDPWLFGKLDEAVIVQHKGQPVVQLVEVKTRRQPNLPRDGQTRNACLQVLLYHRMFEQLRTASVSDLREFLLGEGRSKRSRGSAGSSAAQPGQAGTTALQAGPLNQAQQPSEQGTASLSVPWPLPEPSPCSSIEMMDSSGHGAAGLERQQTAEADQGVATEASAANGVPTSDGGSAAAGTLPDVGAGAESARKSYLDPQLPLGEELQQQCSEQLPDHPLTARWHEMQQVRRVQLEQQQLRQQHQQELALSLPWPLAPGVQASPLTGAATPTAPGTSSESLPHIAEEQGGLPATALAAAAQLTPHASSTAEQPSFQAVYTRPDDEPDAGSPSGPWTLEALIHHLHSAVLPTLPPAAPGSDEGPGHLVRYWYHGKPSNSSSTSSSAPTAAAAAQVGTGTGAAAGAGAGGVGGAERAAAAGSSSHGGDGGNPGAGFLSPDVEVRHAEWSAWLDYTFERVMAVLAGRQEPTGVEREENWKCRFCKFRAPAASSSRRSTAASKTSGTVGAKRQAEGQDAPGAGQGATAQGQVSGEARLQGQQQPDRADMLVCTWPAAR